MKITKSKIIAMICLAVLLLATGYAAFSTVLTINGTANIGSEWKVVFTNIQEESKTSGVSVKATPQASGTTATFNVGLKSPGDKIVYKITLSNQGTLDAVIKDIQASATDSPAIIFSIEDINIGDEIKNKTSKDFRVIIEYDPNVTTQPDKLEKTLTVSIVTEQNLNQGIDESVPSIDQPLYLSSKILKDNTAYADNVRSPYVDSDTGIDFGRPNNSTNIWDMESTHDNGKGLYYTSTNTENNKRTYYFRGAVENNFVKFGTETKYSCTYNGVELDASKEDCLNEYVCYDGMDYYLVPSESDCFGDMGEPAPVEGKATLTSKEVNIIWNIIRINEDGSVRLIYSGNDTMGFSKFNDSTNDNLYVGYMYGSSGDYITTHTNTKDSTVKTIIDDWYEENLKDKYSQYLVDAGFCNDRSVASSLGLWSSDDTALGFGTNVTYYGAYNRINNLKKPQFACPQTNDLFTTSTSSKGNKALINPIGLITVDELTYAGVVPYTDDYMEHLEENYLISPTAGNSSSLTMSPYAFLNSNAYVYEYDWESHLVTTNGSSGVRPVINLRGDVEVTGNGTFYNPYIIK